MVNPFMRFARNNSDALMQTGLGLLSGRTGPEQFAMGAKGFADARKTAMQRDQQAQAQNKTLEYLMQRNPELANLVQAGGVSPIDAVKMDFSSRQKSTPQPTAAMREYEFAKQQGGFGGDFMDYQKEKSRASAPQINMPGQAKMGSIPQGFEVIADPETGGNVMRRIPGGPEDLTEVDQNKAMQEAQQAAVVSRSIADIKDKLSKGGVFNLPEAGVIGSRLADMGVNQEAVDVKNALASLQSVVSFDRLQKMREASPTGGALGAVSENELRLLQASMGALQQDSSPKQLTETLDFVQSVMDKFAAYPGTEGNIAGPQSGVNGAIDIDALIEQYAG